MAQTEILVAVLDWSEPISSSDVLDHGATHSGASDDHPEIVELLAIAEKIADPQVRTSWKRDALERLSTSIHPRQLRPEIKHEFVQKAIKRGLIETAVCLIERGGADLVCAACNFLGDFSFNSDMGSQAVLKMFDRIMLCFSNIFMKPCSERLFLLSSAVSLCANIVATCPDGHGRIVPLVQSFFLPIMRDPTAPDRLVGNMILLLANLSLHVSGELRALRVADVLLELVLDDKVPVKRRSVAESTIIFLLGDRKCAEIDQLIAANVIETYCLPIMEHALTGEEFRGMYPHLVYSARLFQVLAQSLDYAKALASQKTVVPILLRASSHNREALSRLESDNEGRRLALEALQSMARFRLWPAESREVSEFVEQDLPLLLADEHQGVRSSAAALWARLNSRHVQVMFLIGQRLEGYGHISLQVWKVRILPFIFPTSEYHVG
mmetsp:Transcript_143611/g.275861  ORF Transcript_143611/g.275861 Transcript_143611/m.275861 type:complete len:439 (+) Transcript_143611:42-1358(+)